MLRWVEGNVAEKESLSEFIIWPMRKGSRLKGISSEADMSLVNKTLK